jgi:hypothetical protein
MQTFSPKAPPRSAIRTLPAQIAIGLQLHRRQARIEGCGYDRIGYRHLFVCTSIEGGSPVQGIDERLPADKRTLQARS